MLIPVKLDRELPLQRQLYEQLRDLVVSARLLPGTRMPSTRLLAEQFSISRVTVLLTYERLIADGVLEARPAKGTFVAKQATAIAHLPVRALVATMLPRDPGRVQGAFEPIVGSPDPSLFPAGRWAALVRGALGRLGAEVRTEHPAGGAALRGAIAGWLSTSRGIAVASDQVIVLHSRQQALHLVAHLARRAASDVIAAGAAPRIVVEDPCDGRAAATWASEGAALVRVAVDADGLRTDALPGGRAAAVHVTPEHQRPLGVCLAPSRRQPLLDWAAKAGALVLEDDYDGDLRYGEMTAQPLTSLDRDGRVIFLGGFGASLGPWLGVAYLALPRALVRDALAILRLLDDRRDHLDEVALAQFVASGAYARHLHGLSKIYAARRDALLAALERHFGAGGLSWGGQAGLYLSWFPSDGIDQAYAQGCGLADLARSCGLDATDLPALTSAGLAGRQGVSIGFGSVPEEQFEARVAGWAQSVAADTGGMAQAAD